MSPSAYEVKFASSRVVKQYRKLPEFIQKEAEDTLLSLEHNPRPHGSLKMSGKLKGAYRIRVGRFRIVYDINDTHHEVTILDIGHRRDVYR